MTAISGRLVFEVDWGLLIKELLANPPHESDLSSVLTECCCHSFPLPIRDHFSRSVSDDFVKNRIGRTREVASRSLSIVSFGCGGLRREHILLTDLLCKNKERFAGYKVFFYGIDDVHRDSDFRKSQMEAFTKFWKDRQVEVGFFDSVFEYSKSADIPDLIMNVDTGGNEFPCSNPSYIHLRKINH